MLKTKIVNKKGFMLVETLIVSVFILAIFSLLYTNIIPLVGEYERLKNYDNNITIEDNGKIYRYVNDIEYKGYKVNVVEMEEPKKKYPFRIYGEEKNKYR